MRRVGIRDCCVSQCTCDGVDLISVRMDICIVMMRGGWTKEKYRIIKHSITDGTGVEVITC